MFQKKQGGTVIGNILRNLCSSAYHVTSISSIQDYNKKMDNKHHRDLIELNRRSSDIDEILKSQRHF